MTTIPSCFAADLAQLVGLAETERAERRVRGRMSPGEDAQVHAAARSRLITALAAELDISDEAAAALVDANT
jgi:hypothetical protein